jgi:hypothetical protein
LRLGHGGHGFAQPLVPPLQWVEADHHSPGAGPVSPQDCVLAHGRAQGVIDEQHPSRYQFVTQVTDIHLRVLPQVLGQRRRALKAHRYPGINQAKRQI